MSRLSKRLLLVTFVLVAVFGAWFFWTQKQGASGIGAETVTVTRTSILETVTAQGKLEPKDYVDVGVQVSGQLKKLLVEIGDIVKKGDLLAELDPLAYESRVLGNEARLNSLKAQILQKKAQEDLDRSQLRRAQELVKIKAISQQELETRTTALKVTQATIQSLEAQAAEAEANLESDKINLGYTKVYAPMDGIVADRIAREGQTLNANQTTPTVLTLANLDIMTVRAQIAEADVMRIKPGMEAHFAPLGAQDRRWKGMVRQVLPTPQIINDVVLYDALIDVENGDRQLMNGMSAQVFFEIGRADNALAIPMHALNRRMADRDNDKGRAYQVRVLNGGRSEERIVFVGLTTRAQAEVRDGLQENETVLLDNRPPAGQGGASGVRTPRPPGGARL